jgi:hypothetical protein
MARRYRIPILAVVVVALIVAVLLPPATRTTAPLPASTVRGAFHVHSSRSDGSGDVDVIAAAAARAGLQFVILTDHGDATRAPDPPAYHSGVLIIDGVELNTSRGHYAAIGLPASSYPIAGTPADVIEDVHRLGGFGFAAHPGSARPSLSWQEWNAPIDGLEWINGDSEWRDEPWTPVARAVLTYLFRAPQSMATLLDRPESVLRQWDALAASRPVVALAGIDAHARLGLNQRTDPDTGSFHVRLPGYESSFRTFSNHVRLDEPLSGQPDVDARRVIEAIRSGRAYSVIDALATPGSLTFTATSGGITAQMGDTLPVDGELSLHAAASGPPGTTLVLLRNGQRVREVTDQPLEINGELNAGVYRIEVYTADAPGRPTVPWIVSNPIYAGLVTKVAGSAPVPESITGSPARMSEAGSEAGSKDTSTVDIASAIDWRFALAPGTPAGQFAAVRIPVSGGLTDFDRVRFRVATSAPMRAWVQLRAPVGNTERWGRTFYADTESRLVELPLATFAPIGETSSAEPPLDRVDSVLFVVDTLNTLPGKSGNVRITEVAFVK